MPRSTDPAATTTPRGAGRRAQLQMGEMVIVLIIFFAIVAIGIVFYTSYARGQTERAVSEVQYENLGEVAKLVSALPELHCSFADDEKLTCIDLYRAQTFSGLVAYGEEKLHYSELFHGFRAELQCIYPSPCSSTYGIDDYVLFDETENGSNEAEFIVPVVIENPTTQTAGYGLLRIIQVTT